MLVADAVLDAPCDLTSRNISHGRLEVGQRRQVAEAERDRKKFEVDCFCLPRAIEGASWGLDAVKWRDKRLADALRRCELRRRRRPRRAPVPPLSRQLSKITWPPSSWRQSSSGSVSPRGGRRRRPKMWRGPPRTNRSSVAHLQAV